MRFPIFALVRVMNGEIESLKKREETLKYITFNSVSGSDVTKGKETKSEMNE